jgi:pantoate--beta-alanine ligase
MQPAILETIATLRAHVRAARESGKRIALVPTMGALHDGHIELVRQALAQNAHVIVSIFVNPTQFGPNEDFSAYPRTWDADLKRLSDAGAHAVYHPSVAEMYPQGASTTVHVAGVSEGLCGDVRPGHFDGVATIVSKLLLQCLPDIALFGEKDYQQLQVIKRLAKDLDIPVQIIGVPTVRDENGLALSSRNAYLSADELRIATGLNKILFAVAASIAAGTPWKMALQEGHEQLEQAGFDSIDYIDVRDADSLAIPRKGQSDSLRIIAAVRLGKARLIDNVGIS